MRLEFGESDKPPSHSLRLAVGGGAIGRIDVWDNESLSDLELEQLDAYVPWYALALSGVQKVHEPEINPSLPIVDEASVDARTAGEFEEGSLGTSSLSLIEDRRTHQPVATAVISPDVSERHETALALKESEERYRMLAENPYGLIAEMDERARFIYANSNFETILGHAPQTLLGSEGISLIHVDDKEAVAEKFRNAVAELGTTQISFRVRHVDGSYRWFETTLKAYRTARKKLVVIVISRDSTDRIESDEALLREL